MRYTEDVLRQETRSTRRPQDSHLQICKRQKRLTLKAAGTQGDQPGYFSVHERGRATACWRASIISVILCDEQLLHLHNISLTCVHNTGNVRTIICHEVRPQCLYLVLVLGFDGPVLRAVPAVANAIQQ